MFFLGVPCLTIELGKGYFYLLDIFLRQVEGRRNKPRPTRPEIGDKRVTPDPHPMVVGAVKCALPRKTALKLTKACEVTTNNSNARSPVFNTFEILDNRMVKICVNLWPLLASAKEPVEESSGSLDEEEPGTSTDTRTFNTSKSGEQCPRDQERRPHVKQELDRAKASRLVKPKLLPPISKPSPTRLAHSECMGMAVSHTPLPQICVSDQDALVKSSKGTKNSENEAPFPMILLQKTSTLTDSTIISRCRSAQFRLPEISVSSIEGLLQRVAERVGRRERKSDDETWGQTYPDHLLMAGALQNLREKRLQHRGDYRTEGAVRCPEVKPIGGQKGTTLITENGMQKPASLCNRTILPVILSMTKGSL